MSEPGLNTNENSYAELFATLSNLHAVAAQIERALAGLEGKRVTLEEKMIKAYLNELLIAIADYTSGTHRIIKNGAFDIEIDAFDQLALLIADMQPVFDELNKTIDYDWNFLEQYYEHEFYGRLSNEHRFKERLAELSVCVKQIQTN